MAEFHDDSQRVYSEVAGVIFPHISLTKTGLMARPDTGGLGSIILWPAYNEQVEVATILSKCCHLPYPESTSVLH